MPRILLITHGFPPESLGGVEQHVDGLAQALGAAGHEVTVLARSAAPDAPDAPQGTLLPPVAIAKGVLLQRLVYRWQGVDEFGDLYKIPVLEAAVDEWLRSQPSPFDLAHVHHLTGLSTGLLQVLKQQHGIPTVLTLHDYWTLCPRGQMFAVDESVCLSVEQSRCAACCARTFPGWLDPYPPVAGPLPQPGQAGEVVDPGAAPNPRDAAAAVQAIHDAARDLLAIPDALVVPSARAIAPFEGHGIPRERFTVVENGVDTTALESLPIPEPTGRPLRIGFLGTLIPSKGLDVLVQAVQRLPAGSASLRIHGNAVPYHGDDGFLTRVFSGLQPEDDIHYEGPYRTADLRRLLESIDVLAAPARWHEAFGLTVREALAAGRPVLVSRMGGLQDAVADGVEGRVLPPDDIDAWAEALGELVASPERVTALGRGARQRTRGFAAMAAECGALYARIVRP